MGLLPRPSTPRSPLLSLGGCCETVRSVSCRCSVVVRGSVCDRPVPGARRLALVGVWPWPRGWGHLTRILSPAVPCVILSSHQNENCPGLSLRSSLLLHRPRCLGTGAEASACCLGCPWGASWHQAQGDRSRAQGGIVWTPRLDAWAQLCLVSRCVPHLRDTRHRSCSHATAAVPGATAQVPRQLPQLGRGPVPRWAQWRTASHRRCGGMRRTAATATGDDREETAQRSRGDEQR